VTVNIRNLDLSDMMVPDFEANLPSGLFWSLFGRSSVSQALMQAFSFMVKLVSWVNMSYKNGNYCAFYVAEPFNESSLGAHATEDFLYYNLLRSWKGQDSSFPFNDSHNKTYSVRDGSDWESTLKPRLRERLRNSKNVILFLSERTVSSRALREEIDYGINSLELPVIVIYPGYSTKESLLQNNSLKYEIKNLWDKLPILRDSMNKVPTLHVPINKNLITKSLNNGDFMANIKTTPGVYFYP
jgi:hypothetical protein